MKNGKTKLEKDLLLRKKAEELIIKKKNVTQDTKLSYIETLELIHELDVHQIELEMQNEELLLAKKQAEEVAHDDPQQEGKLQPRDKCVHPATQLRLHQGADRRGVEHRAERQPHQGGGERCQEPRRSCGGEAKGLHSQ